MLITIIDSCGSDWLCQLVYRRWLIGYISSLLFTTLALLHWLYQTNMWLTFQRRN